MIPLGELTRERHPEIGLGPDRVNSSADDPNRHETLRGWMLVTATSLLMFSISFGLMKMIAQSPWTEARIERDQLSRENLALVDRVVEARILSSNLPLGPAGERVVELRALLGDTDETLSAYRRDDRSQDERDTVALERGRIRANLFAAEKALVEATAGFTTDEIFVTWAREHQRNLDRIAELESRVGFFYSDLGQILLILSESLLSIKI